jgi:hypothetical protein
MFCIKTDRFDSNIIPVVKCKVTFVDGSCVMEPVQSQSTSPDQLAAETNMNHGAPNPTDEIAISASELAEMIRAGKGTDVSKLVNKLLRDRQAA